MVSRSKSKSSSPMSSARDAVEQSSILELEKEEEEKAKEEAKKAVNVSSSGRGTETILVVTFCPDPLPIGACNRQAKR